MGSRTGADSVGSQTGAGSGAGALWAPRLERALDRTLWAPGLE